MTDIFSIILYYMTGQQLPMPVSLAESDSGDGWGGPAATHHEWPLASFECLLNSTSAPWPRHLQFRNCQLRLFS